jgi:copper chaperone CopZ
MHCAGCVNSVEKALSNVEGVQSVNVSLSVEIAYVTWDSHVGSLQDLLDAVESAGYHAKKQKTEQKNKLQEKREREEKSFNEARKKNDTELGDYVSTNDMDVCGHGARVFTCGSYHHGVGHDAGRRGCHILSQNANFDWSVEIS